MRTSLLELAPVAGFIAGISAEILVRAELPRIDEDRDHDSIGESKALMHQSDVALMQGPHGRHDRGPHRLGPPAGDGPAQLLDGVEGLHRLPPRSVIMKDPQASLL
jgi:hypothetical protein